MGSLASKPGRAAANEAADAPKWMQQTPIVEWQTRNNGHVGLMTIYWFGAHTQDKLDRVQHQLRMRGVANQVVHHHGSQTLLQVIKEKQEQFQQPEVQTIVNAVATVLAANTVVS